jgi:hypothetical protein
VDARNEIREFLTSRRARITPEQAGLPAYGSNRRVAGLRREEAAMLAGISVECYPRLERGNASGVSEEVLELPGDSGQRINVYAAEPASPPQQSLDLLASWSAVEAGEPR